jgi:hypothetical protein
MSPGTQICSTHFCSILTISCTKINQQQQQQQQQAPKPATGTKTLYPNRHPGIGDHHMTVRSQHLCVPVIFGGSEDWLATGKIWPSWLFGAVQNCHWPYYILSFLFLFDYRHLPEARAERGHHLEVFLANFVIS